MAELKFFRCKKCGAVLWSAVDGACVLTCCGEPMTELRAGETDGAHEKHVPALELEEGKRLHVRVGEVAHPMLPEHYIQFIAIARPDGTVEFKRLAPGDAPEATFCLHGQTSATVYEFCNLHGLWKAEYTA